VALAACAAASQGAAPFKTVRSGSHSGIYKHHYAVIRGRDKFAALWKRTLARQYPTPAPPDIDFSRHMVIAVFLGEQRTGGYEITVDRLIRTWNGLKVVVRERHPGAGCLTTQMLTQPFAIIKTPATTGRVSFVTHKVSKSCD
jgi:hypothetical protein